MTFRMTNYMNKKENNIAFSSPSFYTSLNGYHINTKVFASGNGIGKGTHVSVFVYFLKGKYDAKLQWPFVGKVTITLLNQEKDSNHLEETLHIHKSHDVRAGTPTDNMGFADYILHSQLECRPYFLKDDTLYFRVSLQAANHKPWLECTAH